MNSVFPGQKRIGSDRPGLYVYNPSNIRGPFERIMNPVSLRKEGQTVEDSYKKLKLSSKNKVKGFNDVPDQIIKETDELYCHEDILDMFDDSLDRIKEMSVLSKWEPDWDIEPVFRDST